MKKILYTVFSAVALLSIAACSNDDELAGGPDMGGAPNPNASTTIMASTESSTSRAALSGDDANGYNVVWSEGDEITLEGSNSPTVYDPVDYVLQSGAGTTTGLFAPKADAVNWSQCIKVDATYGYNGYEWPAQQTYRGEDIISNAPMRCSMSTGGQPPTLQFKNMGGILRLKLKGISAIKRIVITAPNDPISGTISEITAQGAAKIDANGGHTITLQMNENVQLAPEGTVFNIAMPTSSFSTNGGYSGVEIRVVDANDDVITKTMKAGKDLIIRRSQITNVSFTANFPTGKAKRTGDIDVNWVQLWENGPRFAEYNVGTEIKDIYGGLYGWCGIKHLEGDHDESSYTTRDTAYKLWGSNWRMPTKEEFDALLSNCDFQWTDNYNGSGVKGGIFTGKGDYASYSIFLPAAGYGRDGREGYSPGQCYYWSSSAIDRRGAWSLLIDSNSKNVVETSLRSVGYSVRAVLKE